MITSKFTSKTSKSLANSLLVTVFPPPKTRGVPWGPPGSLGLGDLGPTELGLLCSAVPLGAMGTSSKGNTTWGLAPRPMAPLLGGGGNTLSRGSLGSDDPLPVP